MDELSDPLAAIVDVLATSAYSDNVEPIAAAIDALRGTGKEIALALRQLKEGYISLEIKNSKLVYSNYALRRRVSLIAG
jgi:hypothetical protein